MINKGMERSYVYMRIKEHHIKKENNSYIIGNNNK